MGRSLLRCGLLNQAGHLPDRAFLFARCVAALEGAHALAGNDAVAADLVSWHGRDGDDRCAAVGTGDLGHVDAHLAVGYEVVAQQDEEGLVADLLGSAMHGVAQAQRLVLIDERNREARSGVDRVGQGILALGAQHRLEVLVHAEVLLDLGLLMGVDNHDAVDAVGLECLLDHILDDRLVEHGKQLLSRALSCGKKTGAKTGGRNDGLHDEIPPRDRTPCTCMTKRAYPSTPRSRLCFPRMASLDV